MKKKKNGKRSKKATAKSGRSDYRGKLANVKANKNHTNKTVKGLTKLVLSIALLIAIIKCTDVSLLQVIVSFLIGKL